MVDRQLDFLKNAPAAAFEGFLPLAKQLKGTETGELLIAKALYGFFQWDRQANRPQESHSQHQRPKRKNPRKKNFRR